MSIQFGMEKDAAGIYMILILIKLYLWIGEVEDDVVEHSLSWAKVCLVYVERMKQNIL